MEQLLIINGSPRATKSNSKRYANILISKLQGKVETHYLNISKQNHEEIRTAMLTATEVVLVFPLYVDAIPSTLLHFLKYLEAHPLSQKPRISMIINCGFIEYYQNDVAIEMVQLFCEQTAYPFGSVLSIGAGEAILGTPFKSLVERKINAFAKSIVRKKYRKLEVTMPLPKQVFVKASTKYWEAYGAKHGVTKEQMEVMTIEEIDK